ncbi:CHAT domain-containing protein [Subsaximicrobium wynnwilliamsii]|uniref:CHAT domain-containing protein n=1 Tax=Subsaximicrobium wynnwilliamsii TaxID=291179 RepID=A0A5C6ZDZ6_9FLAO|nr:CHAT domain-containing protein [Subsaximicrobium wynnwilliamsii]TXD82100.1 CHAT domain-containing protein [Subsaximicrobium wynnwilliamsii]TXD87745.1 CHAT domain-containing protein [Subsaximicrobium wynnwilliamsii]TXE01556.1 CHAT domain-containing protein [Subsaximicrobium wynnwilliamsii]
MLWIIDDLGYVSKTLYDFETSLNYYSKSMPLYEKYHPEKLADVGTNYNMMATGYKKLGLRKKEYTILKEAEFIWDNNSIEGYYVSKFTCYEQLAVWNIYYGNFNEAEVYLRKQEGLLPNLIDNFKVTERTYLSRNFRLRIYYNYIELYFKSEDYKKAENYLQLFKNQLPKNNLKPPLEPHFLSLYYSYLARLPNSSADEGIAHLKKAIEIIETYDGKIQLDATAIKRQLFQLQLQTKDYVAAEQSIDHLLKTSKNTNHNLQFFLLNTKANLLAQKGDHNQAENAFKKSISFLVAETDKPLQLETLGIAQLKPFYSFETVNGLILASKFYNKKHNTTQRGLALKISKNLVLLASKVFDNLYLGDRYNDNLYDSYKNIEQQTLSILSVNTDENDIKIHLEALENNATKFTWSKFMYSKTRPNLNIPDRIVNKETELKSLINYYQNELYKNKDERLNLDTLKTRLSESNVALHKLQAHIKKDYASYYNSNYNTFNLSEFQNELGTDQTVLKYSISEEKLYCFIISKSTIGFQSITQPKNFEKHIENYIIALKTFNSDIETNLNALQPIVPKGILENPKTKITIVPDGVLCYLPFETLDGTTEFLNSSVSFSYASSLSLLKDQYSFFNTSEAIKLAYFSAQYDEANQLPSAINEKINILNSLDGKSFYNLTSEALIEKAKQYDVLHFAMHSTINKENPDFSNFNLGNETLLMSNLYHESFKAQLAVLSACETGSGDFENGEGIQSASRAFTYTGIPSIVMSLWKVDDAATAKIMSAFYSNLKAGQTKDLALKNAKISYLETVEEEALKHPYYWAGFIISGNTTALINTDYSLYWYWGIGLCLLVILFYRKKWKTNPRH